jgi:hypothetical protein
MNRNRNEMNTQQAPGATKNPFEAPATTFGVPRPFDARALFESKPELPVEVPADAPEGSYTYALIKSGPEVAAEECELQAEAIEIVILWGTAVLHVEHLSPARSFYVGEEGTDYVLPADKIGASRMPVVLVGKDGVTRAVLPASAKVSVEQEGQTLAQSALTAEACPELAGASQIALRRGMRAKIEIDGVTIQVAAVNAGRAVKGAIGGSRKGLSWHGVSFALHAGLLAAAAFFLPPLGADTEDGISAEDKFFIQHALDPMAEREPDKTEAKPADTTPNQGGGEQGARAHDSEGKAGNTTSRNNAGRMGIPGPKDNADVQVANRAAMDDARTFGMIGLISTMNGGDPSAITARWGGDVTIGNDEHGAMGNMWSPTLGDAAGPGGLGLTGLDEGGGGKGPWIGLKNIGNLGTDPNGPSGLSHGLPMRTHTPRPPSLKATGVSASGKLPGEVIQRVIRQNFGRYRFCYEQGLRANPSLGGRVAVKFVIGRDGSVSNVQNGGSDMPDNNVVSCVVRSFYALSFPAPESGIVTVTYPILFQPGG